MKQMSRLIVTSMSTSWVQRQMHRRSPTPIRRIRANAYLWHFRLERLEAEPIWDSIMAAAGTLDTTVGGPSFDVGEGGGGRRGGGGGGGRGMAAAAAGTNRRAAYMIRGFSTSRDVVPVFLRRRLTVDDGRVPARCSNADGEPRDAQGLSGHDEQHRY